MRILVNHLVRASLSKIAYPPHANQEMFQRAELAKAKAFRNAQLNGGAF